LLCLPLFNPAYKQLVNHVGKETHFGSRRVTGNSSNAEMKPREWRWESGVLNTGDCRFKFNRMSVY